MRKQLIGVAVCLLVFFSPLHADDPQPAPPDERDAIRKGLAYVESKSLAWLHDRKCASCHHVPMMVWVQRDARERGFTIDEQGLQEATEFLLAADNRANVLPKAGEPERAGNSYSMMAAYTILAFRDGGAEPDPAAGELIRQAATHILSKQEADGSWKRFEGRPPIFPLQEATTLLAAQVTEPVPAGAGDEAAKVERIQAWLAANSHGEMQQDLCLRILAGHEVPASVEQLLQRQNSDGGWSQTPAMPSDAYATGQALYALVSHGGVDREAPAIKNGRDFLLKTQKADGSWTMTSRAPNNETSEKGAGNLEPITVAGAAWAVLGLLQCVPER